jgi:hypothetical protein
MKEPLLMSIPQEAVALPMLAASCPLSYRPISWIGETQASAHTHATLSTARGTTIAAPFRIRRCEAKTDKDLAGRVATGAETLGWRACNLCDGSAQLP